MRWTPTIVVLLLGAAALAGCLSEETSPSPANASADGIANPNAAPEVPETNTTPEPKGPASPAWSTGDHWTFSSEQVGELQLVVAGETGSHWTVHATSEEGATHAARERLSFVGEIRQDDLAGQQNDTSVVFFDWPLQAGKTWTTTWDGAQREVTVERVAEDEAHLTAREEGRVVVNYTYDAEAGTFGSFEKLDEEGNATVELELTGHGSGFEGEALRARMAEVLDLGSTYSQVEERPSGSFEVPGWAAQLYVEFSLNCPAGSLFHFGSAPAGPLVFAQTQTSQGYKEQHECPTDVDKAAVAHDDPESGTWGYGLETVSPAGETSYELDLFARTLETVDVAAGSDGG